MVDPGIYCRGDISPYGVCVYEILTALRSILADGVIVGTVTGRNVLHQTWSFSVKTYLVEIDTKREKSFKQHCSFLMKYDTFLSLQHIFLVDCHGQFWKIECITSHASLN